MINRLKQFLLGIVRVVAMAITLPLAMVGTVVLVLSYLWWVSWGGLLIPFGPKVRKYVGRYIGCYPFTFIMVGLFWIVGIWHWGAKLQSPIVTVGRMAEQALIKIADEDYGPIGGLWG